MNRLDRFDRLPLILNVAAACVLSASLAYWAMQLYRPQQRPIAAPPPAEAAAPNVLAATGLFGGAQAASAVASNYRLTGVVAAGRESVAIIAVDGGKARSVPLGKDVRPGVRVVEVYPRYVMVSEGGVTKRVDLAKDAPSPGMAAPSASVTPPAVPQGLPVQPLPAVPAQPPAPGIAAVPIPGAVQMAPQEGPAHSLGSLAEQARQQQQDLGIQAPTQTAPPVMGSGVAPTPVTPQPPIQ